MKFKKNMFFLLSILFLIISIPLLFISKDSLNVILAEGHTPVLNYFFFGITHLGEALMITLITTIIFLLRSGNGLFVLSCTLSASAISQLFKYSFPVPRPSIQMDDFSILSHDAFWEIHSHFSFPSGHTAAAFAMFSAISLLYHNKLLNISCLIFALLVGISRIYLLQHFFVDVYFGALTGLVSSILIFRYIYSKFTGKKWAEFSLAQWIRSKA